MDLEDSLKKNSSTYIQKSSQSSIFFSDIPNEEKINKMPNSNEGHPRNPFISSKDYQYINEVTKNQLSAKQGLQEKSNESNNFLDNSRDKIFLADIPITSSQVIEAQNLNLPEELKGNDLKKGNNEKDVKEKKQITFGPLRPDSTQITKKDDNIGCSIINPGLSYVNENESKIPISNLFQTKDFTNNYNMNPDTKCEFDHQLMMSDSAKNENSSMDKNKAYLHEAKNKENKKIDGNTSQNVDALFSFVPKLSNSIELTSSVYLNSIVPEAKMVTSDIVEVEAQQKQNLVDLLFQNLDKETLYTLQTGYLYDTAAALFVKNPKYMFKAVFPKIKLILNQSHDTSIVKLLKHMLLLPEEDDFQKKIFDICFEFFIERLNNNILPKLISSMFCELILINNKLTENFLLDSYLKKLFENISSNSFNLIFPIIIKLIDQKNSQYAKSVELDYAYLFNCLKVNFSKIVDITFQKKISPGKERSLFLKNAFIFCDFILSCISINENSIIDMILENKIANPLLDVMQYFDRCTNLHLKIIYIFNYFLRSNNINFIKEFSIEAHLIEYILQMETKFPHTFFKNSELKPKNVKFLLHPIKTFTYHLSSTLLYLVLKNEYTDFINYSKKYPEWSKFIKETITSYEVKLNQVIGCPTESRMPFGEKSYIEREYNINYQKFNIPKIESNGKNSEIDIDLVKSDNEIMNQYLKKSSINLSPDYKSLMSKSTFY